MSVDAVHCSICDASKGKGEATLRYVPCMFSSQSAVSGTTCFAVDITDTVLILVLQRVGCNLP